MKKILLFFAGLFVLLLSGCTEEDYGRGTPETKGGFSIYLNIPGSSINTYASVDAVGGEDKVNTLHVLFFEPKNDGTGKFLELHDISPQAGDTYVSGQTVEIRLPDDSNLDNSSAYNLLFIANVEHYLVNYGITDWTAYLEGKTESEVQHLRLNIQVSTEPYVQDNLPMTGMVQKEASQEMVVAELTRIVSRFDVKNNVSDYTLKTVSIWNAFPVQTVWDVNFSDFSLERIKRLYGVAVTDEKVTGGLYAYENFVALPELDDEVTTCLILGMEKGGKLSYYRLNASQPNQSQQLKRNYAYTFNINNVKGTGAGSEEDAYTSKDNLLNVQINEWNEDNQGNIVFDGDNILAVSTTNVIFDHLGGEREYTVFTAGEGVLTVSDKQLPAGFTAELVDKVIYITATPSDVDKAGYVELQFGKLKVTMKISQIGEIKEYLEVSEDMLPMFTADDGQQSIDVKVTSSGPWTATLYNHDSNRFQYVGAGTSTVINGVNEDTFQMEVTRINTDIENKYAFIHVTLDSNPEISAVVVVSQNGFDGITIDPAVTDIVFDADGNEINGYTYTFTITVDDNLPWTPSITGTNKNDFAVADNGDGTVTVTAKGINPVATELDAKLRIALVDNPTVYKEVNITQQAHLLTVDPATFANISSDGGTTPEITVTATTNWTVTIVADGNTAWIGKATDDDKTVTSITGNAGEGKFYISMAELLNGTSPTVTVTVSLDGTEIKETLTIKQNPLELQTIRIQNSNDWYGYLTDDNTNLYRTNYIEPFWESLTNPNLFGATGTVMFKGLEFLPLAKTPAANTDIYVMNCFNGSASEGAQIRSWLDSSDKHLILAFSDDRSNNLVSYLGMAGYTAVGGTGNNVVKTDIPRTINTGSEYDNHPLYDYLFRSGPFTKDGQEISKEDIKLLPYDASNNCLTQWPETMIPLILDPHDSSRLIMGIDPTLRIIYTGELDLFTNKGVDSIYYTEGGQTYTGKDNYDYGPHAEANTKFMNNLIAWMLNVSLKGEAFTYTFK